jgi:hypothetical protein
MYHVSVTVALWQVLQLGRINLNFLFFFETESHYGAQAGLEPTILLPLPPAWLGLQASLTAPALLFLFPRFPARDILMSFILRFNSWFNTDGLRSPSVVRFIRRSRHGCFGVFACT